MSILSNILVYKTLKLLSSKYENWSYYKDGIINADGDIIDKSKSDSYLRFVINIKKLVSFHPIGRLKLSSLPLAMSLIREQEDNELDINDSLLIELMLAEGIIYDD